MEKTTFKKYGINNNWVFTDPETGVFMYQLKWTGITRHVMIKNIARPDDREFTEYFRILRSQLAPSAARPSNPQPPAQGL